MDSLITDAMVAVFITSGVVILLLFVAIYFSYVIIFLLYCLVIIGYILTAIVWTMEKISLAIRVIYRKLFRADAMKMLKSGDRDANER